MKADARDRSAHGLHEEDLGGRCWTRTSDLLGVSVSSGAATQGRCVPKSDILDTKFGFRSPTPATLCHRWTKFG